MVAYLWDGRGLGAGVADPAPHWSSYPAEFLPKALFRIDPNGALSVFTVPLQVLYVVMWTPMMIMTGISALILRLFRGQDCECPIGLRSYRSG